MRIALIVLAVVAVLLVLVGAFNTDVRVDIDLLAGSVNVSLFWLTVGVAGLLALAGVAGWTLGRVEGGDRRRKLERELETTYRRLRESEARSPRPVEAATPVTAAGPAALEANTMAQPAEVVTVEQPAGAATVEQPAEAMTAEQPAETVTLAQPAEAVTLAQPAEAVTGGQAMEPATGELVAEPATGEPESGERVIPAEQAPGD